MKNANVIKSIVKAKASVIDAQIRFDDLKLGNIVDEKAFNDAAGVMVKALQNAIVIYAEYLTYGLEGL